MSGSESRLSLSEFSAGKTGSCFPDERENPAVCVPHPAAAYGSGIPSSVRRSGFGLPEQKEVFICILIPFPQPIGETQ